MILTLDECKVILGIEGNTYDEKIRQFIPYVQDDLIYYCNNAFADATIFVADSGSLNFYRGATATGTTSPDYITDELTRFTTIGFADNMDIVVVGGANTGVYALASVSSDVMKTKSTGEFVDQKQTAYHHWPGRITISRVVWPKSVKLVAAKMVWHLIESPKVRSGEVKSESIDDYSVTYVDQAAAGLHMYPKALINSLAPYRMAVLV